MFKSGDHWIAQCLEYDIAAQAKELSEVHYEIARALVGHLAACSHAGLPVSFDALPAAPREYWERWEHAMRLEERMLPPLRARAVSPMFTESELRVA